MLWVKNARRDNRADASGVFFSFIFFHTDCSVAYRGIIVSRMFYIFRFVVFLPRRLNTHYRDIFAHMACP